MGVMRHTLYDKLKETYPNVTETYGYITKHTRINNGLPKEHIADAYCMTGNTGAKLSDTMYAQKYVRKNNRSIYKSNKLKGGKLKANKAEYVVLGYRLFDKVLYDNKECFIFGRRKSGYFDLRMLDGTSIHRSAKVNDIRLLETASTSLTERRRRFLP
jgi:N6-L-threonylcarbamoyladenine synthase